MFGLWCNGSTTGFGSVCPGSNPGSPTTIQLIAAKNPLKSQVLVGFLLLFDHVQIFHNRYSVVESGQRNNLRDFIFKHII